MTGAMRFFDGGVKKIASKLFGVGDGFEFLHWVLLNVDTKNLPPGRPGRGRLSRRGGREGSVGGGQGAVPNYYLVVKRQ